MLIPIVFFGIKNLSLESSKIILKKNVLSTEPHVLCLNGYIIQFYLNDVYVYECQSILRHFVLHVALTNLCCDSEH